MLEKIKPKVIYQNSENQLDFQERNVYLTYCYIPTKILSSYPNLHCNYQYKTEDAIGHVTNPTKKS